MAFMPVLSWKKNNTAFHTWQHCIRYDSVYFHLHYNSEVLPLLGSSWDAQALRTCSRSLLEWIWLLFRAALVSLFLFSLIHSPWKPKEPQASDVTWSSHTVLVMNRINQFLSSGVQYLQWLLQTLHTAPSGAWLVPFFFLATHIGN